MKSFYEGVVIIKKPGKSIPDEDLTKFLLANQSVFGLAITDKLKTGDQVTVQRHPVARLGDNQLAAMKSALAKLENRKVLLFFGNYPEGYAADDIQPFDLCRHANGTPAVVGCLSGNFGDREGDKGKSPQLLEIESYLAPKFAKLFTELKGDVNRFIGAIHEAHFRKEIEGYFDTGALTIMASNDSAITFAKEKIGETADWGWNSGIVTAEDAAPVREEPVIEEEKTGLDDLFGAEAHPKMEPKPEVIQQPAGKTVTMPVKGKTVVPQVASTQPIKQTHPPGGTKVDKTETVLEMRAPDKSLSNRQKKKFYEQHLGHIPQWWQECRPIEIKLQKSFKTLAEAGDALKNGTAPAPAAAPAAAPAVVHPKVVMPAGKGRPHGEDPNKKITESQPATPSGQPQPFESRPDHEAMPVISAMEKQDFLDKFMPGRMIGLLDRNTDAIFDPEIMGKELEKDVPTFVDIAAIPNIEATFYWKDAELDELQPHWQMVKRMIYDLRGACLNAWQENRRLKRQQPAEAAKPSNKVVMPAGKGRAAA